MVAITSKVFLLLPKTLDNSGFETAGAGGADIWADITETAGDGALANETTIIYAGDDAAKITAGATANTKVHFTIVTVAAGTYRLRFWTRGDAVNGGRYGVYDVTNAADIIAAVATGVTGTTYTRTEVEFTAPAGCVSARIDLWCPVANGGIAYFDAVEIKTWTESSDVVAVPAPTWQYGINGNDPAALVAGTGIASITLDNSAKNSAGKAGLYSPGHTDLLAGFAKGTHVKIVVQRDSETAVVKFIGTIAAIRPSAGLFDDPVCEIEVHDWMGFASSQRLGVIPIASTKRAEEALTTALVEFQKQPVKTDFDVGVEVFDLVFDTDSARTVMRGFLQKLCRNEQGRIYLEGDGTLVFENRDGRPLTTASAFTLSGLMSTFSLTYQRRDIFNLVQAKVRITEVDAAATTVIWSLTEAISIGTGETLELMCSYRDPDKGGGISALEVVNPITVVKFGSVGDMASDNMAGDLAQDNDTGGNSMRCRLTNNHASQPGYLNQFDIVGKGIYADNPLTVESSDEDSIDEHGVQRYALSLEQITSAGKARQYAVYIKSAYSAPDLSAAGLRYLANQSAAIADASIAAEVSTRLTLAEGATGVDGDYYVNKLVYTQDYGQLWVNLDVVPAVFFGTWIWDSSHWDDEGDGRWAL